jgi:hypothetical protein
MSQFRQGLLRAIALGVMLGAGSTAAGQPRPLDLVPIGQSRVLPERVLGASAEPFWDNFIWDPEKVAALKSLQLAYTRFPGGSQSNYYDWKRGLFALTPGGNHSSYYERFIKLASFVARKFPEGISLEQYKRFTDEIGASLIMVPNLETATVTDQVRWFEHLAARSAVPTHIELGNEFWVAMGQDPVVLRHWPEEPTSERIARRYLAAIQPYLPKGAKVAWQATAPGFRGEPGGNSPVLDRLRKWNGDLRPEPWFDAVTLHLYPRLNEVIGRGAAEEPLTPQIAVRNLRALLARVDDGAEQELNAVARQVPGKEIWITEWNPAGGEGAGSADRIETTSPAMLAHLFTRSILTFLRHPNVTIALYFSIRVSPEKPKSMFVAGRGGLEPMPVAMAMRWLNEAANGGVTFQRYVEAGNPRLPGNGVRNETYGAVEAALFRCKGRLTMVLQNVADEARVWRIKPDLKLGTPANVEHLELPALTDTTPRAARVEAVTVSSRLAVRIPPYSLTRITWNTHQIAKRERSAE